MASALAAAHNISEADAEKFLKVVCDVVADALRHDGQVKIKGLGTFKLIGVPEREMVDVNTGERITIEARNRISFSPDAVLRDIINKPFVFFETVVLNEGVVFDDERDTDVAEDDDDQDADDIAVNEQEEQNDETEPEGRDNAEVTEDVKAEEQSAPVVPAEEPSEEPEGKDTEKISDASAEESVTDTAAEEEKPETAAEEEASETAAESETSETSVEETVSDSSAEETITDDKPEEEVSEPSEELNKDEPQTEIPVSQSQTVTDEPSKTNDTPEAVNKALDDARNVIDDIQKGTYSHHHNTRHRESFLKRNFLNIFIILVVLVGGCAFVYGIYGNEILEYLGLDDNDDVKDAIILSPVTTSAAADSVASDSVKKDTVTKHVVKKDTVKTIKPSPVKAAKTAKDPAYYASLDARVRTGAYDIVGLDTTVKVRSGQTLKSISRTYLGEGMECYVEVFNGVKSVKEGDSLKIPKLKWKKKRK